MLSTIPQIDAAHADRSINKIKIRKLLMSFFSQAVSCDEGGVMCMWDTSTGARKARFTELHGDNLLTTATFDARQRCLLTASDDGTVKLWNFNSGSLLRQYACPGPPALTTALLFVHDAHRETNEVPSCRSMQRRISLLDYAVLRHVWHWPWPGCSVMC